MQEAEEGGIQAQDQSVLYSKRLSQERKTEKVTSILILRRQRRSVVHGHPQLHSLLQAWDTTQSVKEQRSKKH